MKSQSNKILRLDEYMMQEGSCVSEKAKALLESVCREHLMQEAEEYEKDEHESHTYEGYANQCASYLKEMMGDRGYASMHKHYR